MVKTRRIPIVLAVLAGGFVFLALALTASAAPNAPLTYPGPGFCSTTLQACINGAAVGDQITIAANTYVTSITLNKAVSLVGANLDTTLLKALTGQRAITVTSAVTNGTLISNLTIQGSVLAAGNGAGVLVQAGARPTLQNLIIQSGTVSATTAFGGGLFTESSLTLTNVTFFQNVAFAGRGGGLGGSPSAHLNLINVTFNSNGADHGGGQPTALVIGEQADVWAFWGEAVGMSRQSREMLTFVLIYRMIRVASADKSMDGALWPTILSLR